MDAERLRELEWRWRGSRSSADKSALLRAWHEVGNLEHVRLVLAAQLGDVASAEIVGEQPWLGDLATFPLTAQVRIFLAAIRATRRALSRRLEASGSVPSGDRIAVLNEGLRRYGHWALNPSEAQMTDVDRFLAEVTGEDEVATLLKDTLLAVVSGTSLDERPAQLAQLVEASDNPTALKDSIRDEVAPWVLTLGDPLGRLVDEINSCESPWGRLSADQYGTWSGSLDLSGFGLLDLRFDGDSTVPPSEDQFSRLSSFLELGESVREAVEQGVFEYYLRVLPIYRDGHDPDFVDEDVPVLEESKGIWRLIEIQSVHLPAERECVWLLGSATWDDEHGLAVAFSDNAVSEVGTADIAY